ncbi:hypothetical protein KP509_34G050000 [Ceratopteris richardii]|nr:hypothetical protein KP509_34G050000 [Ceratopteris richardii]
METWERDRKAFEQLMEDQESELRRVTADTYQVAGMYAMFQSVIFSAVSQSRLLTCSLSWCPACLSAAVWLGAILAFVDKLKMKSDLKREIKETGRFISALTGCLDRINEQGAMLDLESVHAQCVFPESSIFETYFLLSRKNLYALLFLTSFSVLVGVFSVHTLCEHCHPCHA